MRTLIRTRTSAAGPTRSLLLTLCVFALSALAACTPDTAPGDGTEGAEEAQGDASPATGAQPGVPSTATLDRVTTSLRDCSSACEGLVYVRSSLMPLSDMGIEEIEQAAAELDLSLDVMDASELHRWLDETEPADAPVPLATARDSVAATLIGAGATVHFPSLVVHRDGRLLGDAILGYKTAIAYRDMIEERLGGASDGVGVASPEPDHPWTLADADGSAAAVWRDHTVEGHPGAYFRWVPGTNSIAYEADEIVHLLDLESGENLVGAGYIDFVPTPDGRLFVTPARNRGGLEFYDAAEVWREARAGRGPEVEPIFTDYQMRDQYPSVGILETRESGDGTAVTYRVLTSWYDKVAFRDYRVTYAAESGAAGLGDDGPVGIEVRPVRRPVRACPEGQVSLPIMSQDGHVLSARDENAGTTKLFDLADDGACTETLDTGMPTGKVAFDSEGDRIAFSIPRGVIRDGTGRPYPGAMGRSGEELAGVFVLDLQEKVLSKLARSGDAHRLSFPEFVEGDLDGVDGVVFLIAEEVPGAGSRFRLVER